MLQRKQIRRIVCILLGMCFLAGCSNEIQTVVDNAAAQVEKEEVDLDQTIAYVEKYISRHHKCNFRSLLNKQKSKMRVVITFLTILEMMKTGKIEVEQDEIFGEILITAKQSEE